MRRSLYFKETRKHKDEFLNVIKNIKKGFSLSKNKWNFLESSRQILFVIG